MGVGVVAAALFWWLRRRRATVMESRRISIIKEEPSTPATVELKGTELGELEDANPFRQEQQTHFHEIPSTPGAIELGGSGNVYIPRQEQQACVHEMPSTPAEAPRYELAAEPQRYELEGTQHARESLPETK